MSKVTWGAVIGLTTFEFFAQIFGGAVVGLTMLGGPVSSVVIIIVWKVSGWWIRKRNVPPPSRSVENRFLGLSFVVIIVLFFTIPSAIYQFDSLPTSGGTMMYFFCLCPALLMIVGYHAVSYRRQPSEQSAFIVGAGLLVGTLATIGLVLSVMAIASTYYT